MKRKIGLDYSKSFVSKEEILNLQPEILEAHKKIAEKTGAGKDLLGWVDWPESYDRKELDKLLTCSEKIRKNSDIFIVVGIGGSYLGARSAIEALKPNLLNNQSKEYRNSPEIYFAGNDISASYLSDLIKLVGDRSVSVNVISKSGTTTEPAIAFRILKDFMEKKYGKENAKERIFVTTDKHKGALKCIAEKEGYETFSIPDNIGGRYSVLTSVGLLPIAVSGIDIKEIIQGAADGILEYSGKDVFENEAYLYAAIRNILYKKGKKIELLASYEPTMGYLAEWWKQLFGESEGKELKGIYPASVQFTTDLHSLGQYIQEGDRNMFETVINIESTVSDIKINKEEDDSDGLNYLADKSLHFINQKALEATVSAHSSGGVPNIIIQIPELNPYYFGKLIYFFEKACAISGYILGVNPFDQPGVEAYKKKMFDLLEKP